MASFVLLHGCAFCSHFGSRYIDSKLLKCRPSLAVMLALLASVQLVKKEPVQNLSSQLSSSSSSAGFGSSSCDPVCTKCKMSTTIAISKPSGRNVMLRIVNDCATDKRNMERKVKSRADGDPLKTWWADLIKDDERSVVWYRKQKTKVRSSKQNDEELMQIDEEVKAEGIEKRSRREYYGYETSVEENPDWDEEKCIKLWEQRVANAAHKFTTKEGEVFIGKPQVFMLDVVENNMHESRLQKRRKIADDTDLADAQADATASAERFRKSTAAAMPTDAPASLRLPSQAMDVDLAGIDEADSVAAAMSKSILATKFERDLMRKAQAEAEEEQEYMEEHLLRLEKKAEKALEASPKDSKKQVANINTFVIEKHAKLDALIVRCRSELTPDVPVLDYLLPEQKIKVTKDLEDLTAKVGSTFKAFATKVSTWQAANTSDKLMPAGKEVDSVVVLESLSDEYKLFFTRDGWQKQFREAVKTLTAYCKACEKELHKHCRGQQAKTNAKSKLNKADEEFETSSVVQVLQNLALTGGIQNLNISGQPEDYPKKPYLTQNLQKEVEKISTLANFRTLVKWAKN